MERGLKMKSQSNVMPNEVQVNRLPDNMAEVVLTENVIESIVLNENNEEQTNYSYDMYILYTPYRENLEESINANLSAWLELAKSKE